MTNMTSSNVMTEAKQIRAKDLVPNGKEIDGSIHYDEVRARTDADLVEMWKAKFEAVDHPGRNAIIEIMELFTESLNGRELNLQRILAELNWNDRFLKGKVDTAQSTADGAVSVNNQQNTRLGNIETKNSQQDTAILNAQRTANEAKDAIDNIDLSGYAKLISPNFQGVPLTSTPPREDFSGQIASTMWVKQRIDDILRGTKLPDTGTGYIKITNGGPTIQYGERFTTAGGTTTVSLPINFGASNYAVFCTTRDGSGVQIASLTTSSFSVSSTLLVKFSWLAIGQSA